MPRLRSRTITVDNLPAPATKLVITQAFYASRDPPVWAWLIVGAFYDRYDRIIWSTEVFAAHLDIQLESDDEEYRSESESEDESESESESESDSDSEDSFEGSDSSHRDAMSGGWNPVTGRDSTGPRPAFAPFGAPMPAQGQAYIHHTGGPGYNFGTAPRYGMWPGFPGMSHVTYPLGVPSLSAASPYAFPAAPAVYPSATPTAGFYTPQTFAYQPNGTGNLLPRQPQPYPNIDPSMPAAQMTNSSGGTGCEPGYNYFFPAEHTKAHIFKTNTPPWQLPPTAQIPFKAAHIPCNTTMAELLKGFGCTNPTPKKNKCFEIVSAGGGKWYKGIEINGADKDMLKRTIKEVGWDMTRTGNPNEKPVVCLWFCKD